MTQINFTSRHNSLAAARQLDQADELAAFRSEFTLPTSTEGEPLLYFAGHSLGLLPNRTGEALQEECDTWGKYGVKGHFETDRPWTRCHSYVADSLARISGARPAEVVAMNTAHRQPAPDDGQFLPSDENPLQDHHRKKCLPPQTSTLLIHRPAFTGSTPQTPSSELEPQPGQLAITDADVP